jgi:hypothetical protein
MKRLFITVLILLTSSTLSPAVRAQTGAACDRECLRGFITQYLNAMVAHNPEA